MIWQLSALKEMKIKHILHAERSIENYCLQKICYLTMTDIGTLTQFHKSARIVGETNMFTLWLIKFIFLEEGQLIGCLYSTSDNY